MSTSIKPRFLSFNINGLQTFGKAPPMNFVHLFYDRVPENDLLTTGVFPRPTLCNPGASR